MKIAIKNIHNVAGSFHGYATELVRQGLISHLYFDTPISNKVFAQIWSKYSFKKLGLDKALVIFSPEELTQCDVLICFDSLPNELNDTVKNFQGLKIFHIMDYFWNEPLSEKVRRLVEHKVDYIMSYGASDIHDSYFIKHAPEYSGKVIPVPFGFSERFKNIISFNQRKNKCVAMGSVRPLMFENVDPKNYKEEVVHFVGEKWFHKFRRMIVESKESLTDSVDSMLPEFPRYRDYDYDMVEKFNEYKMFVSDESLFYFPSAKAYEGPATGCVMVCSDHQCFIDFGFVHGKNCIMHKEFNIQSMKTEIEKALSNERQLEVIAKEGEEFVRNHFSHKIIAQKLHIIITSLYKKENKGSIYKNTMALWRSPSKPDTEKRPSLPISIQLKQRLQFSIYGLYLFLTYNGLRILNKAKRLLNRKSS